MEVEVVGGGGGGGGRWEEEEEGKGKRQKRWASDLGLGSVCGGGCGQRVGCSMGVSLKRCRWFLCSSTWAHAALPPSPSFSLQRYCSYWICSEVTLHCSPSPTCLSPPPPAPRSLWECGGGVIADGRLLDLIRRVYTFGMCLMKLDLRQVGGWLGGEWMGAGAVGGWVRVGDGG